MTVSNKWAKLITPLIGTENMKYIIRTRCNMETEQMFGEKSYATMKYDCKNNFKKIRMFGMMRPFVHIDYEHADFYNETVKQVIRKHSDKVSRTIFITKLGSKLFVSTVIKYRELVSRSIEKV